MDESVEKRKPCDKEGLDVDPEALMKLAINAARRGIAAGQTPFGCAIARDGRVIAACHNTVWLKTDITAHAEINALREACRRIDGVHLEGAIVATTCEPCPMCLAGLHWARVKTVHFGATIADASKAGFNELRIPARQIIELGGSDVELHAECLQADCQNLFRDWQKQANAREY